MCFLVICIVKGGFLVFTFNDVFLTFFNHLNGVIFTIALIGDFLRIRLMVGWEIASPTGR